MATNLFLIEPSGGLATVVHFVAGFGVAGLLLFRLFWALPAVRALASRTSFILGLW